LRLPLPRSTSTAVLPVSRLSSAGSAGSCGRCLCRRRCFKNSIAYSSCGSRSEIRSSRLAALALEPHDSMALRQGRHGGGTHHRHARDAEGSAARLRRERVSVKRAAPSCTTMARARFVEHDCHLCRCDRTGRARVRRADVDDKPSPMSLSGTNPDTNFFWQCATSPTHYPNMRPRQCLRPRELYQRFEIVIVCRFERGDVIVPSLASNP